MAGFRKLRPEEYRAESSDARTPFGTFAPTHFQRVLVGLARATPLHRGFFRKAMAGLIFGNTGKPLDIEASGCNWRLYGGNNLIEYGLLLRPRYNRTDIDFLLKGSAPGDTFVDIGANIGLYALQLAKAAGPKGRVVAIDANPEMARRLVFNAKASGLTNIQMFDCAVSDHETRASLSIAKEDVAIVAIAESDTGDIPVRTLASILGEAGVTRIHGLKIDIEGHEDKALAPFLESAPSRLLPRHIVIETAADGNDYPRCAAAFEKHGYRLMGRTRQNSLYAMIS